MTSTHGAWRHAGARFLLSGGQPHAVPGVSQMVLLSHRCCLLRLRLWCELLLHAPSRHDCRGELGWCSGMTSTHGAWRHAGARFLLSGGQPHAVPGASQMVLLSLRCCLLRLRLWCELLLQAPSRHDCRGESGWCSDMTSTQRGVETRRDSIPPVRRPATCSARCFSDGASVTPMLFAAVAFVV